jgi:hypothetical protein
VQEVRSSGFVQNTPLLNRGRLFSPVATTKMEARTPIGLGWSKERTWARNPVARRAYLVPSCLPLSPSSSEKRTLPFSNTGTHHSKKPALEEHLSSQNVSHIYLGGVVSNICVLATALWASNKCPNLTTHFVKDAVGWRKESSHLRWHRGTREGEYYSGGYFRSFGSCSHRAPVAVHHTSTEPLAIDKATSHTRIV